MGAPPISRPVPLAGRVLESAKLLRLASDDRLVEQVRKGSQAAFEVLYDRYHRGILGFCRHMLQSREEAEDALQHTFIAAYRDLVGSDKEIQLRAWLYAIARNRCLTMLRARREQPVDEFPDIATEGFAAEVQQREDLRDLVRDVASLPEDQRAALVLSELGDMSHDEIAAVIDCPKDKVKALVFQARTSLQTSRQARETSCDEIRELLANLRGGSLRRGVVRRHVKDCEGCRAFEKEVKHQRQALAIVLPVIPTIGLKHSALAAAFSSVPGAGTAGVAAGGAAAAAAGAGATGASVATGAGAIAAKVLVVAALAGGGVAGVSAVTDGGDATKPASSESGAASPGETGGSGSGPAVPAVAPVTEADPTSTPGKRTRKRPHGIRRGHTDRGKDFAQTRGKKLGQDKQALAPTAKARKEANANAKAKAKAKAKRKVAIKKAKPIRRKAKPVATPRPVRTPRRPDPTPTPTVAPEPTPAPTEDGGGKGQNSGGQNADQ